MTQTTTDSVEKVLNLLRVIKYCCQYQRLEENTSKEILDEAWMQLNVERQQSIIEMIEKNVQPTPLSIAEEMLACESKEELALLKEEFGAELSKEAWQLLTDSQKEEIKKMCATATPKPPELELEPVEPQEELPPEPEAKPEPQTPSSEPVQPTERQITIDLDLTLTSGTPAIEPEPVKSKSLIELSEEETELRNIIDSVLEDTDGKIPPELATAFDELLARQVENESQLKVKIDNYCAVMKSLSDWAKIREREAERLKKLADRDSSLAKVLEARLKNYLESSSKMKLKTKRFNLRVCKNGGKTPIKLNVPVEDLPSEYQITKKLINADLDALREILEKGEELPFANLVERGTHLRYT